MDLFWAEMHEIVTLLESFNISVQQWMSDKKAGHASYFVNENISEVFDRILVC